MVVRYADDLRLFPSALAKVGLVALVALWLLLPYGLSNYQLSVLAYAGISAIGATGLNLLVGYTGQVSLGHGFFIAVGSYSVAYFGAELGWPMVVWLPVTALVGGVIGAVIGPFALRLRGNYLVIASLGMLFVGQYVFANWESFTGGGVGRSTNGAIPRLDANSFQLLGAEHTREHGYFWLVWALVGLVALVAKNVVRGRPGRAMQAVRDRDLAAEVIGVSLGRYKVGAFVWSGAIGAVGGGDVRLPAAHRAVGRPGPRHAQRLDPVRRGHHHRRPRHDLRAGARGLADRLASAGHPVDHARAGPPAGVRRPRRASRPDRRAVAQQPDLRPAHRAVPAVRAARPRRRLASRQELVHELAVRFLTTRSPINKGNP
jgi:ABC-type branched-subunit amino acid transport system permease subunit